MTDRTRLGRCGDRRKQSNPAKTVPYFLPTPDACLQEQRRNDFGQIFLQEQRISDAEISGVKMAKLRGKTIIPDDKTLELDEPLSVADREETKTIDGRLSDKNTIIVDQFDYSETNLEKTRDQLSPQDGNLNPAERVSPKQHSNGKRAAVAHGVTDRTLNFEELPSCEKGGPISGVVSTAVKDGSGGSCDDINFFLQYSRSPSEHELISSKSSKFNELLFASNHSSNPRSGAVSVSEDYCGVCQKRFCNKYYTKKHIQDVHGHSKAANSLTDYAKPVPRYSEGKNFNIGKFWGVENSSFDLQMFNGPTPDVGIFTRLLPEDGPNNVSQLKWPGRSQLSDIAGDFKKFGRLTNLDECLMPMAVVPKGASPQFSSHSFGNGVLLREEKDEYEFGRMLAGFVAAKDPDRIHCDICGKAVCNKHFLKTHKAKFHHGCTEKYPYSSGVHKSPSFGPFSSSLSNLVDGITSTKSFAVEDSLATKLSGHRSTSERSNFDSFLRNVFRADDIVGTFRSNDNFYHIDPSAFANNCLSAPSRIRLEQDVHKIRENSERCHSETIEKDPPVATTTTKVTCVMCGKILCNKYFLKTHMARKHRMEHDGAGTEQNEGASKRNGVSNVDPASKEIQTGVCDVVLGESDRNFADEAKFKPTCGLQCESSERSRFDQQEVKFQDISRMIDKSENVNRNRNGSSEISSDDKSISRVSPSSSEDLDSDYIKHENIRNADKVRVPDQDYRITKSENDAANFESGSNLTSSQTSSALSACPAFWQDETIGRRESSTGWNKTSEQRDLIETRLFRCPHCRKRFKTSPKLLRHKRKTHNINNSSADCSIPENARHFPESSNTDVYGASRTYSQRLLSPFLGRRHVTGESAGPDDTGGSLPLRPFLIKDLAGNDRFCPAVVYLPSLRTLSRPTSVTFTLTPLAE